MDERSKRVRKSDDAGQSGKRKYEPPEILSQEVFETTALTCRKIGGTGGQCNAFSKS
jgi:hypothetical protein